MPFIGADGFCSPIGSGWESRVTSEFGNRIDPITGKRKGHTGMDLAVPTGTPIRAALGGTVTVSKYNAGGYGYYVCIDHGNGLATLYGHCSKLLAKVGQTVEAGDIIALSGSTGRSTGPRQRGTDESEGISAERLKGKIDYEYCNKTDHAGA